MVKSPLNYQQSEYDCVPVTFLNAFSYLCDREQIDPLLIKTVYQQSLDSLDSYGNLGKRGTSEKAVEALTAWLNQYSRQTGLGVTCRFLACEAVTAENPLLANYLGHGGVFLACVHFAGSYHYVLVTGVDAMYVYLFDPYFLEITPREDDFALVPDQPFVMNRRVRQQAFWGTESRPYALGEIAKREGVLICRQG